MWWKYANLAPIEVSPAFFPLSVNVWSDRDQFIIFSCATTAASTTTVPVTVFAILNDIFSIFDIRSSKGYWSYFFKDQLRCILHCTLSQELSSKIWTTLYIKIRQQHFYLTTLCIIKQQAVGRGMIKNFIFYIVDRVLFWISLLGRRATLLFIYIWICFV